MIDGWIASSGTIMEEPVGLLQFRTISLEFLLLVRYIMIDRLLPLVLLWKAPVG